MPRYETNEQFPLRRVYVPQSPAMAMPYAAAPFVGYDVMHGMPNGGARLRIASREMPHETPSSTRSPTRYIARGPTPSRRVIPTTPKKRPRMVAAQPWLPTARRIRTIRSLGGRRFEVL
jgi:hypothetical protein